MKKKLGKGETKAALRALAPYLKRHIPAMILTLFFAAVSVALTLLLPILIGRAIDCIIGVDNVDFAKIARLLLAVGIAVGATAIAQWLLGACNNKIAFEIVRDLRRDAMHRIQRLPLAYLDTHPTGDIVSRVIADAETVADGLLLGFTQLFSGVLTILGTLGILIYLHVWIALCVVVLTPLSLFVARFIARRTYAMFRRQSETRGEQTALIDEMIGGQRVVQAFRYEKRSQARFDEVNERLRRHSLRATFFSSLTNPCTRAVNNLVYAAVALLGALLLIYPGGALSVGAAFTVGTLFSCLSYANQYTKPFNEISGVVTELQNAFACALRIEELITAEPEVPDADDARLLEDPRGEVAFSHVSFSYVPEVPLMRDLSLEAKPGQRIAIVGPTGCGKTTLINLIMRFYDVTGGHVSVDGEDIRTLTRASLRGSIGMVLQDTWVRHATVRENICLGREEATEEEMIAAAKAAHVHGFVSRLPEGYDTMLSEGGEELSQGQRQLISIARVMLTHPKILILDEATSSIDTRTERKVQEAFERLMAGRTSFIVAHRLSTIRSADMILVMRAGDVVEMGTHNDLMARGGFYATLYNSQFES